MHWETHNLFLPSYFAQNLADEYNSADKQRLCIGLFLVVPHSKSSQFTKQCNLLYLFASISIYSSGQSLNPEENLLFTSG